MKKHLAIITASALLALTLNSSLALADSAASAGSTQTATAVTSSGGSGLSATTDSGPAATTVNLTSTPTVTSSTASSTVTPTGTPSNPAPASPQLPPVQDSNGQTVTAGILPGSPFYWLANLIQKLELALTFNSGQKVSLAEHQALQKLAAAEVMTQNGKDDLTQKALNDYSDKIGQAEAFLTKIQDPNSDTAQALETDLSQTGAANIPVLSSLLGKLPPQAAQKVALNIVRSLKKVIKKDANKDGQPDQDQDQAKDIDQDKIKVNEKALTALAMLEKMYGTGAQNGANSNGTTAQTPVSGSAALKTTVSNGEQNKSPVAQGREKGQQGTLMGSGHMNNQISVPQTSKPALSPQTMMLQREADDQDSQEGKDDALQPERNLRNGSQEHSGSNKADKK